MYPFHRDQIYCYVHASPGVERDSGTVSVGTDSSCHTSPRYYVRVCSCPRRTAGAGHCPPCATMTFRGAWPSDGVRIGTGTAIGRGSSKLTTNLEKGFRNNTHTRTGTGPAGQYNLPNPNEERTTMKSYEMKWALIRVKNTRICGIYAGELWRRGHVSRAINTKDTIKCDVSS